MNITEDNLPQTIIDLNYDSDTAGSKSSGDYSDSSSDDEMVAVLKKKDALKERKNYYKSKSIKNYHQLVLANNLRLTYKAEVEHLQDENEVLKKRNSMLQDLLCRQDSAGTFIF